MARNDGIDRTSVRNLAVSDKVVGNTQQHNEREKDSYRNPDIIPQRAAWNVHFKKPTASYTDLFAQLEAAGTISTRGLKPDAHFLLRLTCMTVSLTVPTSALSLQRFDQRICFSTTGT